MGRSEKIKKRYKIATVFLVQGEINKTYIFRYS